METILEAQEHIRQAESPPQKDSKNVRLIRGEPDHLCLGRAESQAEKKALCFAPHLQSEQTTLDPFVQEVKNCQEEVATTAQLRKEVHPVVAKALGRKECTPALARREISASSVGTREQTSLQAGRKDAGQPIERKIQELEDCIESLAAVLTTVKVQTVISIIQTFRLRGRGGGREM